MAPSASRAPRRYAPTPPRPHACQPVRPRRLAGGRASAARAVRCMHLTAALRGLGENQRVLRRGSQRRGYRQLRLRSPTQQPTAFWARGQGSAAPARWTPAASAGGAAPGRCRPARRGRSAPRAATTSTPASKWRRASNWQTWPAVSRDLKSARPQAKCALVARLGAARRKLAHSLIASPHRYRRRRRTRASAPKPVRALGRHPVGRHSVVWLVTCLAPPAPHACSQTQTGPATPAKASTPTGWRT